MKTYRTVAYEVVDAVADIKLNRPEKYNAINLDMLYELKEAIDSANADDDVRVIVVRGAGGKAFSAGIDLADGLFEDVDNLTSTMQKTLLPLVESIESADKPVIASVCGMAVGLAAGIAMQCDLLIMAEDASLRMVFSKLGIVPDGGSSWQLVRKLGYNKALQIALEGRNLDAAACLDSGIANKVVSAADLDSETMQWASALAANSVVSQALTKQLMRSAANGATNLQLVKMETVAQGDCAASDYCKQAYTAFLSK